MTTSMTGADLGGTNLITRRLSVFAASTSALCVIFITAGLILGGLLTGSTATGAIAIVGLISVASTLLTGYQAGLYLGIGLIVIASRTSSETTTGWQLVAMIVAIAAGHEAARLSLDARRPARFGPGFLRRHLLGSTGPVVIAAIAAVALLAFDPSDLPTLLVPLGFLAIAAIGFARRATTTGVLVDLGPKARMLLGGVTGVSLLAIVTVAARARGQIEATTPTPAAPPPPVGGARVERLPDLGLPAGDSGPFGLILLIGAIIAGLLYFALKRPEADFELDDYELDELDLGLALVSSEPVALDDDSEMLDEAEFRDLLDDLMLDIATEEDPGRAIRFGYANVQRRLARNEMARRDDETEREFLTRALPTLGREGDAMVQLTDLFEQARFSGGEVDEQMRQQALQSVERLRNQAGAPDDGETGTTDAETAAETETETETETEQEPT